MKIGFKTVGCAAAYAVALAGMTAQAAPVGAGPAPQAKAAHMAGFKHVVVIYEENHSFDNLYGGWGSIEGEPINGRDNATSALSTQLREDGSAYGCLAQNDVNLSSPPLSATCSDHAGTVPVDSHFTNAPFAIEDYIPPSATTCPPPGVFTAHGELDGSGQPGGCTEDIVHRYYQEQYQLNGGKQNHYTTGSDAIGLTMGYYDTTTLPIYQYLHAAGAPNYIVGDNMFQGAFGGSFLNHQWLVAAAAPVFAGAPNDGGSTDLHSVVDSNGMPNTYPLYTPTGTVKDAQLTVSCRPPSGVSTPPKGTTCGNYAVNTTQPFYQPYSPGTADYKRLPPLTNVNIGDRLSAAGVKWAWYSGGWSNAAGDIGAPGWTNGNKHSKSCTDPDVNPAATFPYCPDNNFQFHHQPLNFFASNAPGTASRKEHLKDEAEFIAQAQSGNLPQVAFIKPIGTENEHPGYASETVGSNHLVDLMHDIFDGPDGDKTLVIVTYDEFGGQWDHVAPPGTKANPGGAHDQWGPGTRIPVLLVSKQFNHSTVDHIEHDTTSIMATLETMFGLQSIGTRDATVPSFIDNAFQKARQP